MGDVEGEIGGIQQSDTVRPSGVEDSDGYGLLRFIRIALCAPCVPVLVHTTQERCGQSLHFGRHHAVLFYAKSH